MSVSGFWSDEEMKATFLRLFSVGQVLIMFRQVVLT